MPGVFLPLDRAHMSIEAAGGALVRRTVLPTGLRILTERVPGASSATVGFWVPVGSRDEQPVTYGSTHFLEHLLFKGTPTRSALDIAVAFDAVGGEHNAVTAKEHTCYYAKVRDRDLPMAIEVLTDMVTSSLIDADEFENEREVILEELAMADDDPADVAGERFSAVAYGGHALARPVGGTPATIAAVSRDDVWGHYRSEYAPSDLVVTVAGAVDHDEVVRLVRAFIGMSPWSDAPAAPRPRRATDRADVTVLPPSVLARQLEQVNLYLGVPGIVATDPRRPTLAVLNSVLGSGMSSRLFQEIRERRGLAYSVQSFVGAHSDAGVVGVYAGCAPRKTATVAELSVAELRRIAREDITSAELQRAVGQLGGASALALEDSDARMGRLGRAELLVGEFADLDETLRRLDAVTPAGVRALAEELMDSALAVAAVGTVEAGALEGLSLT